MRLAGKTALITGAAHGIGRATAERYLGEGAQVWAVDRDAEALATLHGCVPRQADLCDAQAIAALAAEAPPLDILFNCAGMVASGTILDCSEADWTASFDLNVTAMYRLIRAALPAMLAKGGGSIVNMASVASSITGCPIASPMAPPRQR
jgi:2-keto-3-deoxy-L-fuconate dehydrogenase